MKIFSAVSPNIINRMPKYLRCLRAAQKRGGERISSAEIAKIMGTTASQVRQDLTAFGSYGSQGYGYNIDFLVDEIEKILGIHIRHEIAIVGVGGIGKALLEHMEFEKYHYHVTAAFDVNPELIGTSINGVEVYSMEEFEFFVRRNPVDICMLTVPRESAKAVAHQMYMCGVPAIWNFTNEDLQLNDQDIVVQNVNFLDSLFVLTYYLEESGLLMNAKKAANM